MFICELIRGTLTPNFEQTSDIDGHYAFENKTMIKSCSGCRQLATHLNQLFRTDSWRCYEQMRLDMWVHSTICVGYWGNDTGVSNYVCWHDDFPLRCMKNEEPSTPYVQKPPTELPAFNLFWHLCRLPLHGCCSAALMHLLYSEGCCDCVLYKTFFEIQFDWPECPDKV